jgi:hypothetical protein
MLLFLIVLILLRRPYLFERHYIVGSKQDELPYETRRIALRDNPKQDELPCKTRQIALPRQTEQDGLPYQDK